MNHEGRVRDMERAAVNRWFAASPLGTMFDAGGGRMLPMPADAAQPWREQAYARIDRYLVEARPPSQALMMAVFLVLFGLLYALQPILHLEGATIAGIIFGGIGLWHVGDFYKLWRYKRDLRDLRVRIAASLVLRSPLPADLARRYRRGNIWRPLLQVWVLGLSVLGLAGFHFLPPEAVTPAMLLSAVVAVAVAWLLYFLSSRTDRAQAAATPLASRAPEPISRP